MASPRLGPSPRLVPTARAPAAQHVVAVADATRVPVVRGREPERQQGRLQTKRNTYMWESYSEQRRECTHLMQCGGLMLHPRGVSSEVQPRGRAGVGSWLCASTEHTRRSRCEVDRSTHGNTRFIGASPCPSDHAGRELNIATQKGLLEYMLSPLAAFGEGALHPYQAARLLGCDRLSPSPWPRAWLPRPWPAASVAARPSGKRFGWPPPRLQARARARAQVARSSP